MAKRNPYWGKQRGKLGETVLSVNKGVQVQRAYNANPVNPKTKKQTGQRIVFACAVKFFKHAIAQQFKFAFEDKRQNESDYNAFMRHNINIAGSMTRKLYEDNSVAGYGPYVVSFGSLTPIKTTYTTGTGFIVNFGTTLTAAPTTFQQVGNALKTGYGLLDGDIITVVLVKGGLSNAYNVSNPAGSFFNVIQFKIGDSSDTRTLASFSPLFNFQANTTRLAFGEGTPFISMGCVIVSRPTSKGLLVSTTELCLDGIGKTRYNEYKKGGTYYNEMVQDWGASQSAVLEGGLLPGEIVFG